MIRLFLWLGLLALALVTVATSVTQVQPGERAVVRRFGRVLPEKLGPGLHVGLPWGMDRVDIVQVDMTRTVATGFNPRLVEENETGTPPGQYLTGDHNLVNVQAEISYSVREEEVEQYVLQKDRVDAVIAWVAESVLMEFVAGQRVEFLLLRGQHELAGRLLEELPRRLVPYRLGVQISNATLKPITPPEEVREAFARVNQAETQIDTRVNLEKQQADTLIKAAAAKADSTVRLARADGGRVRLEATAEAHKFLTRRAQFLRILETNEDYLRTLWLEEMTSIYTRMGREGRIDVDPFLEKGGISIFQSPRKR